MMGVDGAQAIDVRVDGVPCVGLLSLRDAASSALGMSAETVARCAATIVRTTSCC